MSTTFEVIFDLPPENDPFTSPDSELPEPQMQAAAAMLRMLADELARGIYCGPVNEFTFWDGPFTVLDLNTVPRAIEYEAEPTEEELEPWGGYRAWDAAMFFEEFEGLTCPFTIWGGWYDGAEVKASWGTDRNGRAFILFC